MSSKGAIKQLFSIKVVPFNEKASNYLMWLFRLKSTLAPFRLASLLDSPNAAGDPAVLCFLQSYIQQCLPTSSRFILRFMALRSMKKRYLAGELEFKSLGEDNKVHRYKKGGKPPLQRGQQECPFLGRCIRGAWMPRSSIPSM